jgi:hypothetical protein
LSAFSASDLDVGLVRETTVRSRRYQQRALAEQKRHNDALEKILESHGARLQKLEGERRS